MFHVQRTCDLVFHFKFSAWEKDRTFNASFDSRRDNDSPQIAGKYANIFNYEVITFFQFLWQAHRTLEADETPHERPFPSEKVNQTELFYVFSSHWWLRRGEIWIIIHIKVKNHSFLSGKCDINRWIMDQLKFTQSSSCSSSLCKRLTVVQQISSVISSRADVCSWPASSLTDYWPTFARIHTHTNGSLGINTT